MRERAGKIEVINPLSGDVKGTHKNKRQALAQMRALYANVPDARMQKKQNEPTNPQLWMQAKNLASRRFAVWPSAYASAWASNWYKQRGGSWKKIDDEETSSVTLQKLQRQYQIEEWVDITKPIRDNAGVIVGFHSVVSPKDAKYAMRRKQAVRITDDERQALIRHKFGEMLTDDGIPEPTKIRKKYGVYKKKK